MHSSLKIHPPAHLIVPTFILASVAWVIITILSMPILSIADIKTRCVPSNKCEKTQYEQISPTAVKVIFLANEDNDIIGIRTGLGLVNGHPLELCIDTQCELMTRHAHLGEDVVGMLFATNPIHSMDATYHVLSEEDVRQLYVREPLARFWTRQLNEEERKLLWLMR